MQEILKEIYEKYPNLLEKYVYDEGGDCEYIFDMGYQIGWNYQKTVARNGLRVIVDQSGNVLNAIPIIP